VRAEEVSNDISVVPQVSLDYVRLKYSYSDPNALGIAVTHVDSAGITFTLQTFGSPNATIDETGSVTTVTLDKLTMIGAPEEVALGRWEVTFLPGDSAPDCEQFRDLVLSLGLDQS
jgi:hypothetical protein